MSISQTIHPDHLDRLAIVYVRQSSPHQALMNQESLELQYDLRHRARAAGWDASLIRVIDSDLGRTGRTAEGRPGFQELVALVNEQRVGIRGLKEVNPPVSSLASLGWIRTTSPGRRAG